MATFVHNEPTSLATIQEIGLPETFYAAIEAGIEPAIEVRSLPTYFHPQSNASQVLQAIPNALGALCLNDIGQRQLLSRPSIIPSTLSILVSEKHTKVLLDKENAVVVGSGIDELIRHHPILRDSVFDAVKAILSKIEDLGNAYEPPAAIKHWYYLEPPSGDNDVTMTESEPAGSTDAERSRNEGSDASKSPETQPHDNHIVSFIDVAGRVSRRFLEFGGVDTPAVPGRALPTSLPLS